MGKKSGYRSGINNPDHISESLETICGVKILKFLVADPGSGMEKIRIRDGKNSNPGSGIKHPGSATLIENADEKRIRNILTVLGSVPASSFLNK